MNVADRSNVSYVAPSVTDLGSLIDLTLGSQGNRADGICPGNSSQGQPVPPNCVGS
jgi:hypothetical protein